MTHFIVLYLLQSLWEVLGDIILGIALQVDSITIAIHPTTIVRITHEIDTIKTATGSTTGIIVAMVAHM